MSEEAKNLNGEIITTFLKKFLINFPGFSGFTVDNNNINTVVFLTSTPSELLANINSGIGVSLNEFIETELNDNCKRYNRNIIFYESEETPTSLILRWV